jgi:uncharacterized membrane protein|tara:strand:- start:325 stop:726 length:402 start_codon:yes stop_codon:yes gene_type:complete
MQEQEFKVFNMEMEKVSIVYGLFLIVWGITISFISQSDSMTSYIPSLLGFPILLFGYLTLKYPAKKKIFMHIVVLFGVIIFLGGLDLFRGLSTLFDSFWADLSKSMLLISGFLFSYWNIKSFIFIRKNKTLDS